MATRTAMCIDSAGNHVPVHCKLWENWHGATNLQKTKEQLATDHPDLTFDGWVYDLADAEDVQSLKLAFLSPNVVSITKWTRIHDEFTKGRITRDMVAA